MNTPYKNYQDSVTGAVNGLKRSIVEFMANPTPHATKEVQEKLRLIGLIYGGPSKTPLVIQNITAAFNTYMRTKGQADSFQRLLDGFIQLNANRLFDIPTDTDGPPSLDAIFDEYKASSDLDRLIKDFADIIQRVLDEEDEHLTRQIARELELILSKLKEKEKKSLYEIQTWIDLGIKGLLQYAETHTGGHGYVLAWEGVKAGKKTIDQIISYYQESQGKLMAANGLKFVQKAATKYPQLPSDDEIQSSQLTLPTRRVDPPSEGEG